MKSLPYSRDAIRAVEECHKTQLPGRLIVLTGKQAWAEKRTLPDDVPSVVLPHDEDPSEFNWKSLATKFDMVVIKAENIRDELVSMIAYHLCAEGVRLVIAASYDVDNYGVPVDAEDFILESVNG